MEGGENIGSCPGGARWNPTKEQISMLESLYKQGLRTPTAEQIQQITVRLKAFGHIEGKNVFYWFQNHKARQRQKQKQEDIAYFNRFLHSTPVFPSYQNVVCGPRYLPTPQKDMRFYQQFPKVPLPGAGGFKRRLIQESIEETNHPTYQSYNKTMQQPRSKNEGFQFNMSGIKHSYDHQETLDLFPIHPTGILQAKNRIYDNENDCSTTCGTPSLSENDCCMFDDDDRGAGKDSINHPFFDFFCGKLN